MRQLFSRCRHPDGSFSLQYENAVHLVCYVAYVHPLKIFWLLAGGSISYIVSRRGFKSTRSTAVLAAVFTSTASFDIPVIVRHRTVNSFWDHLENKENFEDALEFIRKAHPVPFMRDFPSFKKSGSTPDQPKEARSQSPWVDRESNDEKAGAALSSQDASEGEQSYFSISILTHSERILASISADRTGGSCCEPLGADTAGQYDEKSRGQPESAIGMGAAPTERARGIFIQ
jgi:hypothetical protein